MYARIQKEEISVLSSIPLSDRPFTVLSWISRTFDSCYAAGYADDLVIQMAVQENIKNCFDGITSVLTLISVPIPYMYTHLGTESHSHYEM